MAYINVEGNPQAPEQVRKREARTALAQYDTVLADLTDNWSGLTAEQKREAIRAALATVMPAVKYLALRVGRIR
jgi:hypothetical protein